MGPLPGRSLEAPRRLNRRRRAVGVSASRSRTSAGRLVASGRRKVVPAARPFLRRPIERAEQRAGRRGTGRRLVARLGQQVVPARIPAGDFSGSTSSCSDRGERERGNRSGRGRRRRRPGPEARPPGWIEEDRRLRPGIGLLVRRHGMGERSGAGKRGITGRPAPRSRRPRLRPRAASERLPAWRTVPRPPSRARAAALGNPPTRRRQLGRCRRPAGRPVAARRRSGTSSRPRISSRRPSDRGGRS